MSRPIAFNLTYEVAPGIELSVAGKAEVEEVRTGHGFPRPDVCINGCRIEYDGCDVTALIQAGASLLDDAITQKIVEACR